jgi:amidophosphoribosyltransferase
MCGVVGLLSKSSANTVLYNALSILQHRGQDAAGIVTSDDFQLYTCKGNGLVRDVLTRDRLSILSGKIGLGHVRYPTAGTQRHEESQPFYVNSPYGLCLVHNGNLTNTDSLRKELIEKDLRHLNTSSDSEVLLNVIAHELSRTASVNFHPEQIFKALETVYWRIEGAFSCVMLINGYGLLAFRDQYGIRPLVHGVNTDGDHVFASESIVLDSLGFDLLGQIEPGEAVFVDKTGHVYRHLCVSKATPTPCLFEYVYLSRPDSIVNGISVHGARQLMGQYLGEQIMQVFPNHDIDVVIPIPDTSRSSAFSLASAIHAVYSEGFVKNRYVGRTFIMPDQKARQDSISLKLNTIRQEFEGKNVLLVDDSIVRGNTSRKIIDLARRSGAKKVYFASASPPVIYPNVYGIDMPHAEDLVAHGCSVEETARKIGADRLFYQTLPDLKRAINDAAPEGVAPFEAFEDSIFTGHYLSRKIDAAYLSKLAVDRQKK